MENKLQNIALIITAVLLIAFSLFYLFKIKGLDNLINNVCEEREYIDWTKEIKVDLTPERIKSLEEDYKNCVKSDQSNTKTTGSVNWNEINRQIGGYIRIFKDNCDLPQSIIKQGYEFKVILDEDRRATSRKEVNDYNNCLKNQTAAIKNRPEEYKFLFIGDALILVSGLLLAFGFKVNDQRK